MHSFESLGLAEPLLRALKREGYDTPTPIQREAIPALLAGRDLVGIAQTGTGKTAAFALPILQRLSQEPARAQPKRCRVLVLAPTRELAAQIAESFRVYGQFLRLSVGLVIGGAKPGPQIRALASGVDVLVATPGRLLDHMQTKAISLESVGTVVLDEADHMLDLGFIVPIRRILRAVPAKRQTLLFSATMPGPISALADEHLKDPARVAVNPAAKTADKVDQRVYLVEAAAKRQLLVELLSGTGFSRVLVFTRTKRGADRLARHLEGAGIDAQAIHGDKSQGQRQRALKSFHTGELRVLVATDIAARGIDVEGITHVVNYELPHEPESYVHRIGRTARAGASGVAISLCDPAERGNLRAIERLTGRRLAVSGDAPADFGPAANDDPGTAPRGPRRTPKHAPEHGWRHASRQRRYRGYNGRRAA
ncbi:MAG: DEAD/DEAH box helicase [Rhodospirillales bacterium]